jgi:hypothetical protein
MVVTTARTPGTAGKRRPPGGRNDDPLLANLPSTAPAANDTLDGGLHLPRWKISATDVFPARRGLRREPVRPASGPFFPPTPRHPAAHSAVAAQGLAAAASKGR